MCGRCTETAPNSCGSTAAAGGSAPAEGQKQQQVSNAGSHVGRVVRATLSGDEHTIQVQKDEQAPVIADVGALIPRPHKMALQV